MCMAFNTAVPLSVLLREDSPRIYSPVSPPLRPHQEAALARCVAIETRTHDISMIRDLSPSYVYADLKSRVGTICDAAGSGKSLVAIALCAGGTEVPECERYVSHCNGILSYSVCRTDYRRVKTSVIVVPHGILPQWVGYLLDSGVEHHVVKTQTVGAAIALEAVLNRDDCPPIILCSDTTYRRVLAVFACNGVCADRLIIDEADTIPLGHAELLEACMYWTITASIPNVLNPAGDFVYMTRDGWAVTDRVKSTGVRQIWRTLERHAEDTRTLLLVRGSDDFVRASLALVPYEERNVLCQAPHGTAVLNGLVDRAVMQALDTDDVDLALSLLPNRDSAENIIANVRAGWTRAIEEARAVIARMEGAPGNRSAEFVRAMEREVQTRTESIEALDERVRGEQICSICYETPVARTLLTCCSSVYCVKCAATWLDQNETCPYCRAVTSFSDAKVVGSEASVVPITFAPKTESVVKLITAILDNDASRRVIVASSNAGMATRLQRPIAAYGLSTLKGSGANVAKVVRAFEAGDIRVLTMEDGCYCTGINLPFVTDVVLVNRTSSCMEEQIVGRAQRPGRSRRLRVWRMVHGGERGSDAAESLAAALSSART